MFLELAKMCGFQHHYATSYHPASKGMVEQWHKTLKAALMCHQDKWTEVLPLMLLCLHTAHKPDISVLVMEML